MNYPNLPYGTLGGGRFGNEIEIHTNRNLKDGTALLYGSRYLWIGTRPLTLMEEVGREARMIVRHGMADILTWLGQPINTEPTSQEIFAALRQHSAYDVLAVVNGKSGPDVVPWTHDQV